MQNRLCILSCVITQRRHSTVCWCLLISLLYRRVDIFDLRLLLQNRLCILSCVITQRRHSTLCWCLLISLLYRRVNIVDLRCRGFALAKPITRLVQCGHAPRLVQCGHTPRLVQCGHALWRFAASRGIS